MKTVVSILINIYKKHGNKFQGKCFYTFILFYKYNRVSKGFGASLAFACRNFLRVKVYSGRRKSDAIERMLRHMRIDLNEDSRFVYSMDEFSTLKLKGKILGNCAVDYSKILDGSLKDLLLEDTSDFALQNNQTVHAIEGYLTRLKTAIEGSDHPNKDTIVEWLSDFGYSKAKSLEEALQRILIINQLQWQTAHILVGLGRLDYVLEDFVDEPKEDEEIIEILMDFCRQLHRYFYIKSNALMGDTGQIIILGGNNPDGTYFHNRYTFLFIEAVKRVDLPDPKILIRISDRTPEFLWEQIFSYMTASVGSPLISNDDVIIPNMIDFGYSVDAAHQYTTSACWEPMPGNGSYEQNNIVSINYLEPFGQIATHVDSIHSYEELEVNYFQGLKEHVDSILNYLDSILWERDPLLSMFSDSCRLSRKDAAEGGCEFCNYGLLTLALGNAVNSLLNIRHYVFETKEYTLRQLMETAGKNYENEAVIRLKLKNSPKCFGRDQDEMIHMVNRMTEETQKIISNYRNPFNSKVKFGLSSPHYIMNSTNYPASLDGRAKGDPFSVHISADGGAQYTELMNFASKLDYGMGRFNGNVVDFMVPPTFIQTNKEKFAQFIKQSFLNGVCQMQINIVSSEVLKKAKQTPDKFPNLIVRVWGFNAYFIQLPEEYQDYLIGRAEESERVYH